jgi:hypothetical protein
VDDFLMKPVRVEELVGMIEEKLQQRHPKPPAAPVRLSRLLRANVEKIRSSALRRMQSEPALGAIAMSDEERTGKLHVLVVEIANQLDSEAPDQPTELAMELSHKHGASRWAAGYRISMLVTETVMMESLLYDLVREHLLTLDTSNLVSDLKRLNLSLSVQLEQSVQAFWDAASARQRAEGGAG